MLEEIKKKLKDWYFNHKNKDKKLKTKHSTFDEYFSSSSFNVRTTQPCCNQCLEDNNEQYFGFLTCSICGNKRCPKATNHRFKCTNSNEPGQKGSLY